MARQSLTGHFDGAEDGAGKFTPPKGGASARGDFVPKGMTALLVDVLVPDDGELARSGREVEQDRVSVAGIGHAQFFEPHGCPINGFRRSEGSVRNENPDLSRSRILGGLNGGHDFGVVQLLLNAASALSTASS